MNKLHVRNQQNPGTQTQSVVLHRCLADVHALEIYDFPVISHFQLLLCVRDLQSMCYALPLPYSSEFTEFICTGSSQSIGSNREDSVRALKAAPTPPQFTQPSCTTECPACTSERGKSIHKSTATYVSLEMHLEGNLT